MLAEGDLQYMFIVMLRKPDTLQITPKPESAMCVAQNRPLYQQKI
jgi:hypothetical protein